MPLAARAPSSSGRRGRPRHPPCAAARGWTPIAPRAAASPPSAGVPSSDGGQRTAGCAHRMRATRANAAGAGGQCRGERARDPPVRGAVQTGLERQKTRQRRGAAREKRPARWWGAGGGSGRGGRCAGRAVGGWAGRGWARRRTAAHCVPPPSSPQGSDAFKSLPQSGERGTVEKDDVDVAAWDIRGGHGRSGDRHTSSTSRQTTTKCRRDFLGAVS